MEKVFQPGKWFVLFCGLLVFVFFSLQYVANSRLEEIGKVLGTQVFTWEWPEGKEDLYSSGVITEARVLRRTETEAVLNVKAMQKLEQRGVARGAAPKDATSEAKLTLYKVDKDWVLGSVELK